MTAGLPDPSASAAVLIGTSRYAHLAQLPAVESNLAELGTVLQDPTVWGLPEAHTLTVREPANATALLDPVYSAGERAVDTLIVYYCGHGLQVASVCSARSPPSSQMNPERVYQSCPAR
ncbi:hypothetical protein ABZ372_31020 [Streptomyces sp. NPDC005921]